MQYKAFRAVLFRFRLYSYRQVRRLAVRLSIALLTLSDVLEPKRRTLTPEQKAELDSRLHAVLGVPPLYKRPDNIDGGSVATEVIAGPSLRLKDENNPNAARREVEP